MIGSPDSPMQVCRPHFDSSFGLQSLSDSPESVLTLGPEGVQKSLRWPACSNQNEVLGRRVLGATKREAEFFFQEDCLVMRPHPSVCKHRFEICEHVQEWHLLSKRKFPRIQGTSVTLRYRSSPSCWPSVSQPNPLLNYVQGVTAHRAVQGGKVTTDMSVPPLIGGVNCRGATPLSKVRDLWCVCVCARAHSVSSATPGIIDFPITSKVSGNRLEMCAHATCWGIFHFGCLLQMSPSESCSCHFVQGLRARATSEISFPPLIARTKLRLACHCSVERERVLCRCVCLSTRLLSIHVVVPTCPKCLLCMPILDRTYRFVGRQRGNAKATQPLTSSPSLQQTVRGLVA